MSEAHTRVPVEKGPPLKGRTTDCDNECCGGRAVFVGVYTPEGGE